MDRLPSRNEAFSIFSDLPDGRFTNEKAKRVLGWSPTKQFEEFWTRRPRTDA